MRKLITTLMVGSAMALTACAADGESDYSYETQAPYADERTVGSEEEAMVKAAPVTRKAERVFQSRQRK